MLICQAVLKN